MATLRGVAEARARRGAATVSRWSLAEREHSSRRRSWTWRPWRARGLMASSRRPGHVEELRFGMVTARSQRERWWRLGKVEKGPAALWGKEYVAVAFMAWRARVQGVGHPSSASLSIAGHAA